MKKTTTLLIAAALCTAVYAKTVSTDTAAEIARNIFSTETKTPETDPELVLDNGNLFVFNNPGGGFVIISADDCAYPVLAYSDDGAFRTEEMPENISGWLEGYGRQITLVRQTRLSQTQEISDIWQGLCTKGASTFPKTPSIIKKLKTAQWDQTTPFNDNCPVIDGETTLSGCVATAVSEIMYYHKWPESQSAVLPGYSYYCESGKLINVESHALTASYDWNKMLHSYSGVYSASAAKAVAALVFDVASMLQSEFDTEGTGALSEDIAPCLVRYYDYDSSAVVIYRDEMSYESWAEAMKAEIDASRPVCYSGFGDDTGHQFVLDGYGTDDYFHLNFGWGGTNNGLYRLEAIDIQDYHFSNGSSAVVNIKPDEGGHPMERIKYGVDMDGSGGLRLIEGEPIKGGTVKFTVENVCNNNYGYIPGTELGSIHADYAMALMDRDGNIKETYEESGYADLPAGYCFSDTLLCTIKSDLALGDHFMYCYRTTGDWTPIEQDYLNYNMDYNGTLYAISDRVAVFDYPAIKLKESYSDGDVLDLRVENCRRVPYIVWYYDGTELSNDVNCVRLSKGQHTVRALVKFFSGNCSSGIAEEQNIEAVINVL